MVMRMWKNHYNRFFLTRKKLGIYVKSETIYNEICKIKFPTNCLPKRYHPQKSLLYVLYLSYIYYTVIVIVLIQFVLFLIYGGVSELFKIFSI